MKPEEVEPYWNKLVKKLEGKTIKKARYLTQGEAELYDWYERGLVLFFTDGTQMILSRDDEGNGPGAAFTNLDELDVIPVIQ